jgi:cell wall assembly regulator SMI1
MKELLEKLDTLIKELRPAYYQKLNSPLTGTQIKELEDNFNLSLPADLKELYLWKNGQASNCYQSFVNNSEFMPLEEVLEAAAELTSMIGSDFEIENWWNKNWLPIFHNGGGSHICYDLEGTFTDLKGQLLEFWKADNDRNVISGNLKSFLTELVHLYEDFDPNDFDETFEAADVPGYPRRFYVE